MVTETINEASLSLYKRDKKEWYRQYQKKHPAKYRKASEKWMAGHLEESKAYQKKWQSSPRYKEWRHNHYLKMKLLKEVKQ